MAAITPLRNRLVYILFFILTIFLGLASRRFSFLLPPWLAKNVGDILYAVMAFWLIGCFCPRLSTLRSAQAAVLFCFGIEFLKFVQTPWLAAARHSRLGALVFGVGFHTSNLVCYVIGVVLAALIEWALRQTAAAGNSADFRV